MHKCVLYQPFENFLLFLMDFYVIYYLLLYFCNVWWSSSVVDKGAKFNSKWDILALGTVRFLQIPLTILTDAFCLVKMHSLSFITKENMEKCV